MKSTFLLFFVFASTPIASAAVTHLAPEHRVLLMQQDAFRVVATSQVPPSIIALFADSSGHVAAPGERWEATDVVADNLPRKRVIWAANYNDLYLLHYERGGIAHSFHIVLAKVGRDGKPALVWRAAAEKYSDIKAFTEALSANRPDDDPKYAY